MEEQTAIARYEQAVSLLPPKWQIVARRLPDRQKSRAEELRLRVGQRMTVLLPEGELWPDGGQGNSVVTCADLEQLCDIVSGYSRYAVTEALSQGYLTAPGGYRVGLCGTVVLREGEQSNLRAFSSACIRIAREKKGLALPLLPQLMDGERLCSTLILSPPGLGKTTLLRDLVRCLSDGDACRAPYRVALVDERGELAGMHQGVAQLDVGCHTDVLDGCPKAKGITMVLRGMNPQIIAVDELGGYDDISAVTAAAHCGTLLLATVHADTADALHQKPWLRRLIKSGVFRRAIIIDSDGAARRYTVETL